MINFEAKITAPGVQSRLDGLLLSLDAAGRTTLLRKIAAIQISNTKSRFTYMNEPSGGRWEKLRAVTVLHKAVGHGRRERSVGSPIRIGLWKGDLVNSIKYRIVGNEVIIGSDVPYATTFHFGAKKHSFGNKTPWGDIPSRKFLGTNKPTNDKVLQVMNVYFSR